MRVLTVTATNCKQGVARYGAGVRPYLKCPLCKLGVKIDERVLSHSGNGKIAVHLDCLVGLVGEEPEFHDYEAEFERVRAEYLK